MICGIDQIPRLATFSRHLSTEPDKAIMTEMLNGMARSFHEWKIMGHISRDSTAIPAREKSTNTKTAVANLPAGTRKWGDAKRRGSSGKESDPPGKAAQDEAWQVISELNMRFSWDCKRSSQGNAAFWRGVQAPPGHHRTRSPGDGYRNGRQCPRFLSPFRWKADGTEDGHIEFFEGFRLRRETIVSNIRGMGRIELIDHQKRWFDGRTPFDPGQKVRFKIRSSAGRADDHLKDWPLPASCKSAASRKSASGSCDVPFA